MNEVVVDKIAAYINELAAQLGVAAEYIYPMIVRQMFIEGVVYAITSIVFLALTFFLWRYLIKNARKFWDTSYKTDSEFLMILGYVITGIISIVVTIVAIGTLPDALMQIFNPEYYAIKNIIEMVSGK